MMMVAVRHPELAPLVTQVLGVCRCRFQEAIIARKVRALAVRHPECADLLLTVLEPPGG